MVLQPAINQKQVLNPLFIWSTLIMRKYFWLYFLLFLCASHLLIYSFPYILHPFVCISNAFICLKYFIIMMQNFAGILKSLAWTWPALAADCSLRQPTWNELNLRLLPSERGLLWRTLPQITPKLTVWEGSEWTRVLSHFSLFLLWTGNESTEIHLDTQQQNLWKYPSFSHAFLLLSPAHKLLLVWWGTT